MKVYRQLMRGQDGHRRDFRCILKRHGMHAGCPAGMGKRISNAGNQDLKGFPA